MSLTLQGELKMPYTTKVTLLKPNNLKVEDGHIRNHYVAVIIFFLAFQSGFLYFLLTGNLKHKVEIGLIMFLIEGGYLILFKIIKILLKNDIIKIMFFQSSFMSIGVMFTLAFSFPFIFSAFLYNIELFKYYMYIAFSMFFLAFLYVMKIDCNSIVNNSLKKMEGI